jgi:hypothetical protein
LRNALQQVQGVLLCAGAAPVTAEVNLPQRQPRFDHEHVGVRVQKVFKFLCRRWRQRSNVLGQ